jgi:hypothetical protein
MRIAAVRDRGHITKLERHELRLRPVHGHSRVREHRDLSARRLFFFFFFFFFFVTATDTAGYSYTSDFGWEVVSRANRDNFKPSRFVVGVSDKNLSMWRLGSW